MQRLLRPLGLAALFLNPSFAQTPDVADTVAARMVGTTVAGDVRPSTPLTLDVALERAARANPELAAARREVEALEAGVVQARTRPNPELAAMAEDTRSATRTTRLQINQPVELGGKRATRIEAAGQARAVAEAALRAKRADIRADVTTAFFDALIAQERLRLAQANADLARRTTAVTQRRVQAGKVSPIEETRVQVSEAGVRVALHAAERELAAARSRLAGLLGDTAPGFERLAGDLGVPTLPRHADLARRAERSPDLQWARIELERRRALAEVERRRRIPDVTVSVGAQRDNELDLDQAIVGISVPVPLFDRNQGNLEEALRRVDQARDELSAAELRLSVEFAGALGRLTTARNELEALERDILPGAQNAYDAVLKGFELGKFGFLEVLDAQRTLSAARFQALDALREAHRAAASLERLLGDAASQP